MITKERLRSKPFMPPSPHIVILGAGASKAAMPSGDKSGKTIPLMDDLPKVIGAPWEALVKNAHPPQGNFETTFSWIRKNGKLAAQLSTIEELIRAYFQDLELPDYPTVYDYLVLGLRGKDLIATFNWDPFLMQAHRRNGHIAELPDIRFLHGCSVFASCIEHDILGGPFEECPVCHRDLCHGQLFFPDEDSLRKSWAEFFPHYHNMIFRDFWDSSIARWPRRTAEWKISASIYGEPSEEIGPFRTKSLTEMQEWFRELADAENVAVRKE